MRARQGARSVMAATTRAQMAPEENPTSSARLVSTAHGQSLPRRSTSTPAVTRTLTSCPATVEITVQRVPSRHSAKPHMSAYPPSTGMYCIGIRAKKAPEIGVHQRPSSKAGRP